MPRSKSGVDSLICTIFARQRLCCRLVGAGDSCAAVERGGNNLNSFADFCTENGSNRGQNLALTVLYVPCLLVRGLVGDSCAAVEQGGKNLNGITDFRTENGSSQGQNLALTVFCVPNLLDSGLFG